MVAAYRFYTGPLSKPGSHAVHNQPLRYKTPTIKSVDPSDTLQLRPWLINTAASCTQDFAAVHKPDFELTVAWYRWAFIAPEDDADITDEALAEQMNQWERTYNEMSALMFGWVLPHIAWENCHELRALVKGTADTPGLAETSDGRALFDKLHEMSSLSSNAVQTAMQCEWSSVFSESHLAMAGRERTGLVFNDATTAQAVMSKLHALLENYESVPSQAAQASDVWIKAMLTLLRDDVPQLHGWGSQEQINLVLNPAPFGTRLNWVTTVVTKIVENVLPALRPVIVPALDGISGAGLHAARGDGEFYAASYGKGRGAPFGGRGGGRGRGTPAPWSSDGLRSRPPGLPERHKRLGDCLCCDCRACANTAPGAPKTAAEQLKTCSVYAKAPAVRGSSDDNKSFIQTNIAFLAANGNKFMQAPYLKGASPAINQLSQRMANLCHVMLEADGVSLRDALTFLDSGARVKRQAVLAHLARVSGDEEMYLWVLSRDYGEEDGDVTSEPDEPDEDTLRKFNGDREKAESMQAMRAALNVAAEADFDTARLCQAVEDGYLCVAKAADAGDSSLAEECANAFARQASARGAPSGSSHATAVQWGECSPADDGDTPQPRGGAAWLARMRAPPQASPAPHSLPTPAGAPLASCRFRRLSAGGVNPAFASASITNATPRPAAPAARVFASAPVPTPVFAFPGRKDVAIGTPQSTDPPAREWASAPVPASGMTSSPFSKWRHFKRTGWQCRDDFKMTEHHASPSGDMEHWMTAWERGRMATAAEIATWHRTGSLLGADTLLDEHRAWAAERKPASPAARFFDDTSDMAASYGPAGRKRELEFERSASKVRDACRQSANDACVAMRNAAPVGAPRVQLINPTSQSQEQRQIKAALDESMHEQALAQLLSDPSVSSFVDESQSLESALALSAIDACAGSEAEAKAALAYQAAVQESTASQEAAEVADALEDSCVAEALRRSVGKLPVAAPNANAALPAFCQSWSAGYEVLRSAAPAPGIDTSATDTGPPPPASPPEHVPSPPLPAAGESIAVARSDILRRAKAMVNEVKMDAEASKAEILASLAAVEATVASQVHRVETEADAAKLMLRGEIGAMQGVMTTVGAEIDGALVNLHDELAMRATNDLAAVWARLAQLEMRVDASPKPEPAADVARDKTDDTSAGLASLESRFDELESALSAETLTRLYNVPADVGTQLCVLRDAIDQVRERVHDPGMTPVDGTARLQNVETAVCAIRERVDSLDSDAVKLDATRLHRDLDVIRMRQNDIDQDVGMCIERATLAPAIVDRFARVQSELRALSQRMTFSGRDGESPMAARVAALEAKVLAPRQPAASPPVQADVDAGGIFHTMERRASQLRDAATLARGAVASTTRAAQSAACVLGALSATVVITLVAIACAMVASGPTPHGTGRLSMMHAADGEGRCTAMPNATGANATDLSKHGGSSLWDSGATHYVHGSDLGAVPGSWQPDINGLRLGDDSFLPVFGSVLKRFVPPASCGGPDIERRVVIAPGVAGRIWSHRLEVDTYGSSFVDAPGGTPHYKLKDGRVINMSISKNGLRFLDLPVRLTDGTVATVVALSSAGTQPHVPRAVLWRVTGVGKRFVALAPLEFLRLWHCVLGHLSTARLLATLRHTLILDNVPAFTPAVTRAYDREHCDTCDAFLQRRLPHAAVDHENSALAAPVPSPGRALRPLYRVLLDVFGPVPFASAQHGYRYGIGLWDEATSMRWVFGAKTHTTEVVQHIVQTWRASIRLLRPDLDVEIIRTDGAGENRSSSWHHYLAANGILDEEAVPYSAWQMGGIERTWGYVPSAGAMLAAGEMGKRHWFSALRYAIMLSNVACTSAHRASAGASEAMSSAFDRFARVKPRGDHLHVYGAPVRYYTEMKPDTLRADKFDEHALAGFYVGPSPSNPDEKWVWNGTRHVSVGGSHVIDETRFLSPVHLDTAYFDSWPRATPDDTPAPGVKPAPRKIQIQKQPLPVGTRLEFRFMSHDSTTWAWYEGAIASSRARRDGAYEHEIKWLDARWPSNEWIDLASPVRVWRVPSHAPAMPAPVPALPAPAPTAVAPAPALAPAGPAAPAPATTAAKAPRRSPRLNATSTGPTAALQHVLVVFAGAERQDNLPAELRRRGHLVTAIDTQMGGPSHDVLRPSVQRRLREAVLAGTYTAIYLAPPCNSFSTALDAPLRDRLDPDTIQASLTDAQRETVTRGNKHANFAASLALIAHVRGIPFTIENPPDRGDDQSDAWWPEKSTHCPIWLLSSMRVLAAVVRPRTVTFPQCALGAPSQKYTTLLTSSEAVAESFADLTCQHEGRHEERAYGADDDGQYTASRRSAAYPHGMDVALAEALTALSPAAPESTTKIDGIHPVSSSTPYGPVSTTVDVRATFDPARHEEKRLVSSDERHGANASNATPPQAVIRVKPRSVKYDPAARGLLNRADTCGVRRSSSSGSLAKSATTALLASAAGAQHGACDVFTTAAEFVDMPALEYVQSDVPEAAADVSLLSLDSLQVGDVADLRSLIQDGVLDELYVFGVPDEDGDEHPVLAKAHGGGVAATRKTVVYYTPDGVAKAIEPKGVREALASLQKDQWIIAMDKEMANLESHGAFHYVPAAEVLKRGSKILRMTWVFKIKINDDGTLNKFKARFCVVGTGQVQGRDFWESFASGARGSSVKLAVILTVVQDWEDFHFDLDGAYLDAEIDADVYVDQAAGRDPVVGNNGERMVMALDKAIYGTVQAGRLFTKKFRAALVDIGFEVSLDDESVYRLDHALGRCVLATHVDDGIGGSSCQQLTDWVYAEIEKRGFKFSQRGRWSTVLGFGVKRDRAARTVVISAGGHIRNLVRDHLASEVAANLNPATPTNDSIMHLPPCKVESTAEAAANVAWRSEARALKGALIHIAQVHPAIQNGTSRCCQYMATPTRESHAAAKRILAWLSHRQELGVTFGAPHLKKLEDLLPPRQDVEPMSSERDDSFYCTVDSDLPGGKLEPKTEGDMPGAGDPGSHRAQLGYSMMIAGACFDSASRRQHSTAVDTAAAELFAASSAAALICHLTGVLCFLSFGVLGTHAVRVWCDNAAAVMVTKDATSIKRLAYIARRIRFMQELQVRGVISILDVDGKANPADALTKHVGPKALFQTYMANMYNTTNAVFKCSHALADA